VSNYNITFFEKKTEFFKTIHREFLTFPEAVFFAYQKKGMLGHGWEITCVAKTVK